MNATKAKDYNDGKALVMQQAFDFLGHDAVFFKTSIQRTRGEADPMQMGRAINATLNITHKYVHVSAAGDPDDESGSGSQASPKCTMNMLAAFVLVVQPGVFLECASSPFCRSLHAALLPFSRWLLVWKAMAGIR